MDATRPARFAYSHLWCAATRQNKNQGKRHAWADAGLAAALPSHYRSCRYEPRGAGDRDALGRRRHPRNHLCRDPRPSLALGATAGERRHPARRPGGDARVEQLASSGGLVRDYGDRRRLSHGQSAAVSRPDRLDRQSRRGPRDAGRPHLHPAAGKARRQTPDHRALCRADRCRAHAANLAEKRGPL